MAHDERARHTIYEHMSKFRDLEQACTQLLGPSKPVFTLLDTLDHFIDEHCELKDDGSACVEAVD